MQKIVDMYMNARLAVNMAGLAVVEEDEEEEEEDEEEGAGGDAEDAFTDASAVDGVSTALARACSANRRERIKSKDVPWLLAVTHNFHCRNLE